MGFGINKIIKILSVKSVLLFLKSKKDTWTFRKKKLTVSVGCNIRNTNFGNKIFLGENVSIINSFIDDYSYINSNSKIRNTKIGKFCSIGPNVQVVLGAHPINFVSTHPAFYANNKPFSTFSDKLYINEYDNVIIGNDVWIGEGVLIPSGVIIGDGAVITSRAVVTKDVEPYTIVGGIPAKYIKHRFDKETISKIIKSEWWNWDEKSLKDQFKSFHDPNKFVN